MLFIKHILLFVFLFGNLLNSIYATNSESQECYDELLPELKIENIPDQVIGETFRVRAHMASSAIYKLYNIKDISSVIISIRLYGNGFDVNDSSPVMQDIAKEDGTWEWEVTAKKAGNNQRISFEVVRQDGHPILNCVGTKKVNVRNIPLVERLWNDIYKQWITIVIAICSLTISIISICLASRK